MNVLEEYKNYIWVYEDKYYYFDNGPPDDEDYQLLTELK
jgi:hypothetical protein